MTRSYVYACILMLLSSVMASDSVEEMPASSELVDLMYQTENEIDTGPGPGFVDLVNYDRDLGPIDDKTADLLLKKLMGAVDQETPDRGDYGSKWDTFYKLPALHVSPKRAIPGLFEPRSVQDRLRAQAKERKRMSGGMRPRVEGVQPEWKAKKGKAASKHMVCYFKLCSWRG